ncbi:MAG: carboxypeptidase regulatory-like domain-containing protein, partial [Bacteroidota bacterium]
MKYLLPFLLILSSLQAQHRIAGTITDSTAMPMAGASIVLMQAADSVLSGFALSNDKGRFQIAGIKDGSYLLQVTFMGYATHWETVEVTENLSLDPIAMQSADMVLETVTIEGEQTPLRMLGDTIEYNADAFGAKPTDAVEDLLRKLPGVEVERDGTIRAQGERVGKVLVDGKEFFGDDPQMATKNLPADAVDKVQVFDKASELAEFTGIDDGNEQKTINLELKPDKKQGIFGSVEGGYGTENRFMGRANVNRFSNKLQLSVLGLVNNINEQGFSFSEYLNFIGGLGNMMAAGEGGGGGSFRLALDPSSIGLPISQGLSNGFVNTGAGGVNFNLDLSPKTKLSTSYLGSRVNNLQDRTALRRNFLGGETFSTEEAQRSENLATSQRVNLKLEQKIDSFNSLTLRGSAGQQMGRLNDKL